MIETAAVGGNKPGFIEEIMKLLLESTNRIFDDADSDFQFPLALEEALLDRDQPCTIFLLSDIVCDILRVDRGSRFFSFGKRISPTHIQPEPDGCEVVCANGIKYGDNLSVPQLARTLGRLRIFLEIR